MGSNPLTSRIWLTRRRRVAAVQGQVHHEVQAAGDQGERGFTWEALGREQPVGGDALEDIPAGSGVQGGQGAVVALAHRLQHQDDLGAEDLTDDDTVGVHPQRAAHQLLHGHRAKAF